MERAATASPNTDDFGIKVDARRLINELQVHQKALLESETRYRNI